MDAGTIRAWLQSPVTFGSESPGSHAGLMLDVETPPAKAPAREEVGRGEVEMRAGMIMRRTSTGNRTVFALYAR